jgi:tetratricopeptide (TPR) repeat protein
LRHCSIAYLVSLRRFSEGLSEEKRALELDPLNLHANNRLGEIFLFQGDYDKAIGHWRECYGEVREGSMTVPSALVDSWRNSAP